MDNQSGTPQGTDTATETGYDDHIAGIESLLDEPEQGTPKKAKEEKTVDDGDEPELTVDDLADEDDEENPDQPEGDREIPDTAKIRLEDGSEVTVKELKRGHLREADYTRKTMDLANDRKALEERNARVSEAAQTMNEQRDFLLNLYQRIVPPEPRLSDFPDDLHGYIMADAAYRESLGNVNAIADQINGLSRQTQEQAAHERQQRLASQQAALIQKMPELKNPEKFTALRNDVLKFGTEKYGFTADELGSIDDARFIPVLKDAIEYRKLLAKRLETKTVIDGKPRLVPNGRRMDTKAVKSRDITQRAANLRKTGSLEAGISSLMDLDL